jgi:signal peptidase II
MSCTMTKKRWYSLLFILILLGVDQLSKYFFYTKEIWAEVPFLDPLFNTGISRGILIPMGITLLISVICTLMFSYFFYKNYLTRAEFSFFIAWTLGNLIDRVALGGVRDFIALGNFPVFNLADMFLTIAVILLFIREILLLQRSRKTLDS